MPTSKIGENISRKAGVVIIVILAVTAFFGYSMSQIEFGIEEDSFNPQTDIYQTLQEVNQAFGSEGSMTQVVVRSIDGSNILSRDAMLEILEFQIELENNEKVKATLANGGEGAVSGPPDMVYAILLMLNGTEMIGANLLLANSSMTPGQFQFAELLAQNINAQVDSLVLIMDSTDPAVTANIRQAALDLYSLTPSLAAMASEESTEGDTPSSNPLFDNLAVVSSTPTMPGLKGNATDILVRQFELVEMMADSTGGSGGVDPLSTLMPVLLEPGQSRENRTFALGGTLAMMDMTYEILQGPFNSAISMTQLSGGILAYAMAGDWDNVTLYNSMLGASAGANSTRLMTETMMLDSLNNSMASLLFHINSTSGSTDVLGAVNHTMENTTTVLSFSAAYPTLHQQMAEYNQTLGFIKMQIMMGEYGNLSVLAQMTGGLIPSVMTAMGNTYVAGSSFSQIASDSMVLGTANNTLDNITAASNLFNRCNETAGSFGGMTFMISIFRPIVQNLYDIYNSVAPEPFVEAATSFFAMLGGETEGDDAENLQMDPAILSPLKDAIAGYRDIQWSGAGASITGAGDYLLLSQMMPLSFPDMPGGDGGANGLPGENGDEEIPLRAQQRQWLENITDQEIRHGLLQASEYQNHELRDLGNWTYLTYVSSASEALGAGQNVSAASERLMSIMQEYNSTTEYGWTNATSIAHYAQTMGGVGVMLEETGGQLSGMARLFLRLPDLGDQLGQITSQFPALLSKDFSYSTGTAQGGMIIIRQSAEINRTAIEDSHRIISPMAYDFQGEHVYMSPLAFTVIFDAINESAQGTLSFLFPMAIIFIIVVLLVNYRSVSETVLSLLALMMAIIWVFGIAVLLGYQFNVILIAVPILIIGLGIDYAIHLVMRYKEELKKGKGIRESAAVSIHMVGGALFLTTITTMIGFLSNTTSTILPIRDFGFLSALGILCSLIVMITFVPAIKIVFDERREKKGKNIKALHKSDNGNSVMGSAKEKGEKALSSILGGSAAAAEHHPYKVLAIVVIVSLIGAYGASQLTTEFDIMDFLPEDVEESNTIRYMMDNFEFSESYVYIYVKGDMTDPQVLLAMEETSLNTIDSPGTAGEQPMSPVQVICQIAQTSPLDRDYNLTLVMAIEDRDETGNCLPDSDVAGLYDLIREDGTHWTSLSRVLYYNEETGEYDKALLRVRETTRSDGEVEALKDALGKDAAPFKSMESVTHVSVVGDSIVGKDTLDAINENQIFSLILTIIASTIVLTLILGFLDRSALLGGVTIVPILLVIIWMWGSMQFMGYSLNVMTNMIAALSIGLGLDYAIHITHRFREELDKTGDPDKACREAVTKTGAGITGAAVTTMGAFAILGFSTLVPMQIFGQITALAVLYGYLSSVFVLPTILVLWAKSRQKRVQRKNGLAEEKSKESKKSVNDGAEEAPAHI